MKKYIIIIIIAVIIAIVVYRVATFETADQVQSISQIQKEKGVPVEVAEVAISNLEDYLNLTGTVEGIMQADVLSEVMEEIAEVKVGIGEYVDKDDVIIRFNSANPQVRLTQAELAFQDAKRDLERMEALFKSGAISEQALDKTRLGYEIAKTNRDQAADMLNVKAPISGVVTDILFFEGETPPPGSVIAKIARTGEVRIKISASSIYRNRIREGQKAYIFEAAHPERKIIGKVERAALASDPENRTFDVYVRAANKDEYLQPGMSVEIQLVVKSRKEVKAIPFDALFKENDGNYVFRVVNDKAEKVAVELGFQGGNSAEILSGLEAGDRIVVNGQNNLVDGDPVLIVDGKDL